MKLKTERHKSGDVHGLHLEALIIVVKTVYPDNQPFGKGYANKYWQYRCNGINLRVF